jgi:outer membrane protein assembly factor BamB
MKIEDMLFVGVKRRVLALDRNTGKTVWERELQGSSMGDSFVTAFLDRGNVYAHTKGTLFCLDAENGRTKWENPLTGCGYGIVTMASVAGSSGNQPAIVHKKQQDAAADGSAAATSAAASG